MEGLGLAKWSPSPVPHLPGLITGVSHTNLFSGSALFLLIKLKRHQCSGNAGLMVLALGGAGVATALRGDPSSFQMLVLVDVKQPAPGMSPFRKMGKFPHNAYFKN